MFDFIENDTCRAVAEWLHVIGIFGSAAYLLGAIVYGIVISF